MKSLLFCINNLFIWKWLFLDLRYELFSNIPDYIEVFKVQVLILIFIAFFNESHVDDFISGLNRKLVFYVLWDSLPCIPGLTRTYFVALPSLEFIIILPQASTSGSEMNITS